MAKTKTKLAAKKSAKKAPAKKAPAKKPMAAKAGSKAKHASQRADYNKPTAEFFARQNAKIGPIVIALDKLIKQAEPKVESMIKWGQPFYCLNGKMFAAVGAHKAHANLILVGSPKDFVDPDKRLTGSSKGGRHIKLTDVSEIPSAQVKSWIKVSAKYARAHAKSAD